MARRDLSFRVFVSSTFGDMVAERNVLDAEAFPAIQERCLARGARFQAIDLRWGVSQDAGLDHLTIPICLSELRRCREISPKPCFIIMLGDRYGWRPLPWRIDAAALDRLHEPISDEDWSTLVGKSPPAEWKEREPPHRVGWYRLDENANPAAYVLQSRSMDSRLSASPESRRRERADWRRIEADLLRILRNAASKLPEVVGASDILANRSATHLEIEAGLLASDLEEDVREHIFCYERRIVDLPRDSRAEGYRDLVHGQPDTDAERSLEALKASLRAVLPKENYRIYDAVWTPSDGSGVPTYDLKRLCSDVREDLERTIDRELIAFRAIPAITRESAAHEDHGERLASPQAFQGRRAALARIQAYLDSRTREPLIVCGPAGSGKSALLARVWADRKRDRRRGERIIRFVGATPGSSSLRSLLSSLVSEATGETRAAALDDLIDGFSRRLMSGRRRREIFLDGLDRLESSEETDSLRWIPSALPRNVRLVISISDENGSMLQAAADAWPGRLIEIPPLTKDETREIVAARQQTAKRRLRKLQLDHLLDRLEGTPWPLYARLALDEAMRWRSFDDLPRRPDGSRGLAGDVEGLIDDIFDRLERPAEHGRMLCERTIGSLAASRRGLAEDELLAILSRDPETMAEFHDRAVESPPTERLPVAVWSRLLTDLDPYLAFAAAFDARLVTFSHPEIASAARRRYLSDSDRAAAHDRIADYFAEQPLRAPASEDSVGVANSRKADELVWQLVYAGRLAEADRWLKDLEFIQAKCEAGMAFDLVADYDLVESAARGEESSELREEVDEASRVVSFRDASAVVAALRESVSQEGIVADSLDGDSFGFDEGASALVQELAPTDAGASQVQFPVADDFAEFVRGHVYQLAATPQETATIGFNRRTTGPVAEGAEAIVGKLDRPWIERIDRPAAPRLRGVRVLSGHSDSVWSVALSRDGKVAVSGANDGTVRVWNAVDGSRTFEFRDDTDCFWDVSVSRDGRLAFGAGKDGRVRVWSLRTGRRIACTEPHSAEATGVCFCDESRRTLSCGEDVRIWTLKGAAEGNFQSGELLQRVACSRDGRLVAAVRNDGRLILWDGQSRNVLADRSAHRTMATGLAVSDDGRIAVTGGADGRVLVWDLRKGVVAREFHGGSGFVNCAALTPDGRIAVTSGEDAVLRIWDVHGNRSLGELVGHSMQVMGVAISADGRVIASGSKDDTVRIWNTSTAVREASGSSTASFRSLVSDLVQIPGKTEVISTHWNGEAWIRDLTGVAPPRRLAGPSQSLSLRAAVNAVGTRALIGDGKGYVTLYDLVSEKSFKYFEAGDEPVSGLSFSPAEDGALALTNSGVLYFIEFGSDRQPCRRRLTSPFDALRVRISLAAMDPTRVGFNSEGPALLRQMKTLLDGFRLSPDGETIALEHRNCRKLQLRSLSRKETWLTGLMRGEAFFVRGGAGVSALAYFPDGSGLVVGGWDGRVRVFDSQGRRAIEVARGGAEVAAVAALPNANGFLVARRDRTIRLHDRGGAPSTVHYAGGLVTAMSGIDPDGRFAVGTQEGVVEMLRLNGVALEPAFVTPGVRTRTWTDDASRDGEPTFVCPRCATCYAAPRLRERASRPCSVCGLALSVNAFRREPLT